MNCWDQFLAMVASMRRPRILELGSLKWPELKMPSCRSIILGRNPGVAYVGVDIQAGQDVDVVADAHALGATLPPASFDVFICRAALEHVRRPWVVAAELAKVVRPGGLGFVQTHQTFPLHGYPSDYFRFSVAATKEIFAADVGWKTLRAEHEFPCRIVPWNNIFPHAHDWNFEGEAYLNVVAMVERIGGGP